MKLHELLEHINIEDRTVYAEGQLDRVVVDPDNKAWIFYLSFPNVLPISSVLDLQDKLIVRFTDVLIEVNIEYKNKLVPKNQIPAYLDYVYEKARTYVPSVSVLRNYKSTVSEIVKYEVCSQNDLEIVKSKIDLLQKELDTLGVKIDFLIVESENGVSTQKMIEEEHTKIEEKMNTVIEENFSKKKISTGSVSGVKARIEELPSTLDELEKFADDKLVIEGYVFQSSSRQFKSGATLVEGYITNFTDSIKLKKSIRERDEVIVQLHKDCLHEGNWVKCSGYLKYDNYSNDVVFEFTNITTIDKEDNPELIDDAEDKRAELHIHTKMSSMDGITHVEDYVKKAVKWGHRAIAITDHNTVQAFPDFDKATRQKDILPIYGVELSYIDDFDVQIARNEGEINLQQTTFVVFDIETTGFSACHDEIIEIAAVKLENGHRSTYQSFVKANRKLSEKTKELTSITDGDLLDAPDIETVLKEFYDFARGSVLVAHNADFDMGFIYENFKRHNLYTGNYPTIDTLQLARALYQDDLKAFNLKSLSRFLKVNLSQHHRADADADATASIFEIMLQEAYVKGKKYHHQLNELITDDIRYKMGIPKHITVLAKNRVGLTNMYKILSDASTVHFHREPRALRSVIEKYRDGILIGSSCIKGEVFEFAINKDYESLKEKARFYDYLEIQPPSIYAHLAEEDSSINEYIVEAIKRIVKVGDELLKPVVATGDVHHIYKDQVAYRKIYLRSPMVGGGFHPLKRVKNVPSMHLRTTKQMIDEFSFLENAHDFVVKNVNLIIDQIETFDLFPSTLFTPTDDFFKDQGVPSIAEEVRNMVWNKARDIYGSNLPNEVKSRIDFELDPIINRGFSNVYYISHLLVKRSLENKYLVGSRGSVGSSFVATMMDITEVNPLPPHYVCPKCKFSIFKKQGEETDSRTLAYQQDLKKVESGYDLPPANCPVCGERLRGDGHDIPFATFLGFKGDKVPDIDLNFSGEYQAKAHSQIREMFGIDNAFRAGTISTIQEKTAYGYVKGYAEDHKLKIRDAEVQRLVNEIQGVRRSTGQHPGGIVVVPKEVEIYDVTPIQYPADDITSDWRTTHFDYHSFENNLFKIDVLGHDNPTVIRRLMDYVEMNPNEFPFETVYEIPMTDPKVMSLFGSTEALGLYKDILSPVGTYGVPELGTSFVRQMLEETKPKTFAGLIKISGLSHGTDVWLNNAKDLVQGNHPDFNKIEFKDIIGCRDDIMINLIYRGLDPEDAYDITETARRTGKFLTYDQKQLMREKRIPDWYIWSCDQIKYMFPKAHATAYVMEALRIAWFKVHKPIFFYATYLSLRADHFALDTFLGGYNACKAHIEEIQGKSKPTDKEIRLLTVLEVVLEMHARGYSFKPIDIEKSQATEFVVSDDRKSLLLPFVTINGLGKSVADSIIVARGEAPFSSIDDLGKRTRLSKTLLSRLAELGSLDDLKANDDGDQIALF